MVITGVQLFLIQKDQKIAYVNRIKFDRPAILISKLPLDLFFDEGWHKLRHSLRVSGEGVLWAKGFNEYAHGLSKWKFQVSSKGISFIL